MSVLMMSVFSPLHQRISMNFYRLIGRCILCIPLQDVYMFFDEIQLVQGWELFVLRVYKNYCKHIFITGSTAKMLSEEMASALRGWPDEYREYPLSFEEYLSFKGVEADKYSEEGKA